MNLRDILFFMDSGDLKMYIISSLTVLHFINCFLTYRHNKKINKLTNNTNDSANTGKLNLSACYFAFLLFVVMGFFLQIPFIKQIIIVTSSFFLIYYLIITPLFSKKSTIDFQEMNQIISTVLIMYLTFILIQKKAQYFDLIANQLLLQILVIFIILLTFFLIMYTLLINFRIIFYYLSVDYLTNLNNKLFITIKYIDENYDLENAFCKIDYKKSKLSILISETKAFILFVVFDFIIDGTFKSTYFFIRLIIDKFCIINNKTLFTISKIAVIFTMFSLYLLIQISGAFNTTVISSYEFIASTIIIPLLLEGLLKKQ